MRASWGEKTFFGEILREADRRAERQLQRGGRRNPIDQVIKRVCKEEGIEEAELRNGGKRRKVFRVRARISYYLSHEMGRPWRR